jgi:hypothetical protein
MAPPPVIRHASRTGEAFLEHQLSEESTWNTTQLAEALKERFKIRVTPRGRSSILGSDGLPLEAHPLRTM